MSTINGYTFDDDPARIDVDAVWAYLGTDAYWGRHRTRAIVEEQIAGAWRVVGCYVDGGPETGAQVGFARALSDGLTLAYLADVYVLDAHRGRGLGSGLVRTMVDDGPGRAFRWLLHTRDAHEVYARFGFAAPDASAMERPARSPGVLRIRPLTAADEEQARAAQTELAADGFPFLFIADGEPFAEHIAQLEREAQGRDLPAGRVPATFLVADVDGDLVGRVSIRHELTSHLERIGGHVGYGVRPAFRRRGFATALLRHALAVLAGLGVDVALVTCDERNAVSAAVIERCGGVLRDHVTDPDDGHTARRYDVPTGRR